MSHNFTYRVGDRVQRRYDGELGTVAIVCPDQDDGQVTRCVPAGALLGIQPESGPPSTPRKDPVNDGDRVRVVLEGVARRESPESFVVGPVGRANRIFPEAEHVVSVEKLGEVEPPVGSVVLSGGRKWFRTVDYDRAWYSDDNRWEAWTALPNPQVFYRAES